MRTLCLFKIDEMKISLMYIGVIYINQFLKTPQGIFLGNTTFVHAESAWACQKNPYVQEMRFVSTRTTQSKDCHFSTYCTYAFSDRLKPIFFSVSVLTHSSWHYCNSGVLHKTQSLTDFEVKQNNRTTLINHTSRRPYETLTATP